MLVKRWGNYGRTQSCGKELVEPEFVEFDNEKWNHDSTTMELAELNDHTYARALADEDIGNNALSCMGGPVQEDVLGEISWIKTKSKHRKRRSTLNVLSKETVSEKNQTGVPVVPENSNCVAQCQQFGADMC